MRRDSATIALLDDEAAAHLISVYCSGLAKAHAAGSEDYALALQVAKREVRRQDKWAKP